MPFQDKIALVTGSGRGIGRAIALHFAQQGADVAVNFFRNRAPAEQTARKIEAMGRRALLVKADVGDLEDLGRMFDEVEAKLGGLDILIHNAASGYNRPVMEQKPKGWDWTMNINARALLFAAQRAVPLMEGGGRTGHIVAVSSLGAVRAIPNYAAVGASKAALESLVRHLAVELAPKNVRVNAVSAGVVDTDALKHFPNREEILAEGVRRTPAGRLLQPGDVADAVLFLVSPLSSMMVGQTMVVDGGYSIMG
jgi:enoyl-[acyl-carrier protein] reductase III